MQSATIAALRNGVAPASKIDTPATNLFIYLTFRTNIVQRILRRFSFAFIKLATHFRRAKSDRIGLLFG